MAKRPVFVSKKEGNNLVDVFDIEFKWFPGFAKVQKQKSINSLHNSFSKRLSDVKVFEISSKSDNELGVALSAFNLSMTTKKTRKRISVESAFQGSKVFKNGGPYSDLLYAPSKKAKKDPRLRESGKLVCFNFFGQEWPLEPKTLFYDWIYINSLYRNPNLSSKVIEYLAFTDIEFNPEKSINCQAHSVALFVALYRRGLIEEALSSHINFKELMGIRRDKDESKEGQQLSLPGFNEVFEPNFPDQGD